VKTKLKPGDKVYCVIEYEPYDDKEPPWEMGTVDVMTATDRRITLARNFRGMSRTRFEPSALGRVFFATPEEALAKFVKEQQEMIALANRKVINASRGLAWARSKGAKTDAT
jgi:hypothetical protein